MKNASLARILRQSLHPVYRKLETVVHPLRYLFLEITRKCNLRCRHCGSDCSAEPLPDELKTGEWLAFIDYLKEKFEKRAKPILVLTGGEPLCHPDLMMIMRRAEGYGFPLGMVTNGWLLHDANVKRLKAAGLTSLTVSLDGLEESHDWLRGRQGSFDKALSGISLAAEASFRFLDVVTCVNPRNLEELPRILSLLQGAGVERWRLFNIFPVGRASDDDSLRLDVEGLRTLFNWIVETRRRLSNTRFHLDFSCEGFLPPTLDHQVRDEPYFCRAGICIGSVLADGAISACPNISRALVQGNIRRDDFETVWETAYGPFRDRSWMRTGPCADCRWWKRCQGNSLHLWDDEARQTRLCYHRALSE